MRIRTKSFPHSPPFFPHSLPALSQGGQGGSPRARSPGGRSQGSRSFPYTLGWSKFDLPFGLFICFTIGFRWLYFGGTG